MGKSQRQSRLEQRQTKLSSEVRTNHQRAQLNLNGQFLTLVSYSIKVYHTLSACS